MCRFNDLRNKEVINVANGKRLGFVCDVEFDLIKGSITAVVLPSGKASLFSFGKNEDIIIKWEKIKKIGDDIIIVDFKEN